MLRCWSRRVHGRPLVIMPRPPEDRARCTSRCRRGSSMRLPLASFMPQKTVRSLVRPIVYLALLTWLPLGSSFNKTHGRGVAKLTISIAGHLSSLDVCMRRGEWLHQLHFALNQTPMVRGRLSRQGNAHLGDFQREAPIAINPTTNGVNNLHDVDLQRENHDNGGDVRAPAL